MFDFLWDFTRLNRRMHVKSFTVDQTFAILGGRNIGDEYFDANAELNFRDRDAMAVGPSVAETRAMFDQFWNWALTRPVGEIAGQFAPPGADEIEKRRIEASCRMNQLHGPLPQCRETALEYLEKTAGDMIWASARLIHDPPPNPDALGASDTPQPGSLELGEISRGVRSEMLLESAYLVLDDDTLNFVEQLRERGVRVRALTNSLASNDVTANHAAYARRRAKMLKSGVELFELRPDAASCRRIVRNETACAEHHVFGLHAKTYVLDRRIVYVGSLNMNMRSRYLNAESGLVIESPALAERIANDIESNMEPANSWRPMLDERGRLRWHEGGSAASPEKVYGQEPRVGWSRRMRSAFIALFPLEKYL
jgi:cardiolipin synthase C